MTQSVSHSSIGDVLLDCTDIHSVIPSVLFKTIPHVFDFTAGNKELASVDLVNPRAFCGYIDDTLRRAGARLGIGGYGEHRVIYRRSDLFQAGVELRSVHLGVDLWMSAHTPLFSPLPATVHSFNDNAHFGDYGPTVILEHLVGGVRFYTLFGHLSRASLDGMRVGMNIEGGQQVGTLGEYFENGNWPPHLHFQIISDLLGRQNDFPGVATISESEYFLSLCPNPNLLLRIGALN